MEKKKMTFETSMDRLEEIVSDLEKNDRSLDETIQLFEEGLKLIKTCDSQLKHFEDQVDSLMQNNGSEDNEN